MDMSEAKPILLLVTSQDWGGVQAFLFDLALELKNRGLPVKVVAGASSHVMEPESICFSSPTPPNLGRGTCDAGRELGSRCLSANIPFIELRHMARDINPWPNFLSLIELIRLFRRERPQTVHLNSTMMGVVGSLAAKLTSVPWTVYCIGGWVFNERLPNWKKKLYISIEKISARWKDVVVCVHPGDEKLARDLNIKPRRLLTTIPNGIDVAAFEKQLLDRDTARSALAGRYTLHDTRYTLVATIANAYPPKNLLWYLDTCKTIHERDANIRFVIIGDGPQMDELQKKHADLKQDSYVLLTGRRMDAKSLYRAFDIFVLPSTKEGMSITLLEAMAARIPIVATDVGANKWMLDNGAGVIVPPNDTNAMVDAVIELSHDENRRRSLAENSYQEVTQRFTWQKTVEETIKTLYPSSSF